MTSWSSATPVSKGNIASRRSPLTICSTRPHNKTKWFCPLFKESSSLVWSSVWRQQLLTCSSLFFICNTLQSQPRATWDLECVVGTHGILQVCDFSVLDFTRDIWLKSEYHPIKISLDLLIRRLPRGLSSLGSIILSSSSVKNFHYRCICLRGRFVYIAVLRIQALWTEQKSSRKINILELQVIYWAYQGFITHIKSQMIQQAVRICYLNKQEWARSNLMY